MISLSYASALAPESLLQEVRRLLDIERRVEWLVCRYLADLAEANRFRQLGFFSDICDFARSRLGLGARRTRERVRIGRALRSLPAIETAFAEGRLSFGRTREVTRVATPETEARWLDDGLRLPVRVLEKRVSEAGGGSVPCDGPARISWQSPDVVDVRVQLPAAAWALLEKAMSGARTAAETPLTDAEAIEAVARAALGAMAGADPADPRRAVVLYECRDCGRTETETGRTTMEIPPAQAAALACGAPEIDLATHGRAIARGGPIPNPVRRAVLLRDRMRCRAPGCGRRLWVDVHHVRHRSDGGEHSRRNCVTLCTACHTALHEGRLSVRGDADHDLAFFDADGRPLASPDPSVTHIGSRDPEPLTPTQQAILALMGRRGAWTADAICEESRLPVPSVVAAIAALEISGRIHQPQFAHYEAVTGF